MKLSKKNLREVKEKIHEIHELDLLEGDRWYQLAQEIYQALTPYPGLEKQLLSEYRHLECSTKDLIKFGWLHWTKIYNQKVEEKVGNLTLKDWLEG